MVFRALALPGIITFNSKDSLELHDEPGLPPALAGYLAMLSRPQNPSMTERETGLQQQLFDF